MLPEAETEQPTHPQDRLPGIVACIASALLVIAITCGLAAKAGWLG